MIKMGGLKPTPTPRVSMLELLSEGTLIADGTEQTLAELLTTGYLSGNVDLSNLQAGDTVRIREYVRIKSGGDYKLYDYADYSGVQSRPAMYVARLPSKYGVKITLQQTAGTYRSYDYHFFKEG